MGGNALRLLLDLLDAHVDRRAADGPTAAAVRAHTKRHAPGVAVHDLHIVEWETQLARGELRERRLVPLAVAVGAREDGDLTRRVHAHRRALPQPSLGAERTNDCRWRETARLDVT